MSQSSIGVLNAPHQGVGDGKSWVIVVIICIVLSTTGESGSGDQLGVAMKGRLPDGRIAESNDNIGP
jgi:hypothetical protein